MKRAAILLVVLAAAAPPARGEPREMAPEARAYLDRGLRAYRDRDWGEAIRELRAGYAVDPHPDFLFPWAQATRLSGDCAGALPLYRRALAEVASDADRRDIEGLIDRCEDEVARARPPPPTLEEPAPARSSPVVARVEAPGSPSPPWYADRPGGALAIGGALGLAAGAALFVAAAGADDDAASASTLDDFVAAADRADQRRLFGTVALTAGAALAAGAAFRYAVVARRSARKPSLAVAPAPGGAVLALGAAF